MNLALKISVAGEEDREVELNLPRLLLGSLASNQVVFKGSGVDPIHALIEEFEDNWTIFDLGSDSGVKLNGQNVDVESTIKLGDKLELGSVVLTIQPSSKDVQNVSAEQFATIPPPPSSVVSNQMLSEPAPETQPPISEHEESAALSNSAPLKSQEPSVIDPIINHSQKKPLKQKQQPQVHSHKKSVLLVDERLFAPKMAKPAGNVLEIVSYWGDTILSLEHYHGTRKGYDKVATIGTNNNCHFPHAGEAMVKIAKLAEARSDSYRLFLGSDMTARIRRKGAVHQIKGKKKIKMGRRDLAQIKCGPISYFMMYIQAPRIKLVKPKSDPLFTILSGIILTIFLGIVGMIIAMGPQHKDKEKIKDDIEIALPVKKIRDMVKKIKKKAVKPVVKLKPVPKAPPKKVIPKKPPVVKPQKKVKPKPVVTKPRKVPPKKVVPNKPVPKKPTNKPKKPNLKNLGVKSTGTFSTKSKTPNFKLAGKVVKNKPKGIAGGNVGAGMNKAGAQRKGKDAANNMGTQDGKSKKSSGRSLAGLGLGTKVSKQAGGVYTNFKNSNSGGMGKSMGTGSRTQGYGGTGSISSTGISGSKNGLNKFGTGSGGFGSGNGGTGGLGNGVGGKGIGSSRARPVVVASQDSGLDVAGGGLSAAEINKVIRANIGKFRACYSDLIQTKPSMAGTCMVSFTIGSAGTVTKSNSRSCIRDNQFKSCMLSRMKQLRFPKPRGGASVSVNYPFSFQKR